jgi:hypothetical protein
MEYGTLCKKVKNSLDQFKLALPGESLSPFNSVSESRGLILSYLSDEDSGALYHILHDLFPCDQLNTVYLRGHTLCKLRHEQDMEGVPAFEGFYGRKAFHHQ